MIILLVVSLLASAAGLPRSRGGPVHRPVQAQSGRVFQHTANAQNAFQQGAPVHIVPVPLSTNSQHQPQSPGATFQVDPNLSLQPRPVSPTQATSQQHFPNPSSFAAQPPTPQQSFPNPNPYPAQFPNPQQTFQNQNTLLAQPQAPQQSVPNQTFHNPPGSFRPQTLDSIPGRSPLLESNELVKRLVGNPPGGALLVGTNPPIFPIEKRLISNYTKLRPVVTDTFRCSYDQQPKYVGYGYYADVENECQIFHVCLPWKELYPKTFDTEVTYQFSFICPNQTVFSQDTLTCTWESDAIPCHLSPELYWLNDNFFRKVQRADGFGERYAEVNEKLTPPLKYDYDDFNSPTVTG